MSEERISSITLIRNGDGSYFFNAQLKEPNESVTRDNVPDLETTLEQILTLAIPTAALPPEVNQEEREAISSPKEESPKPSRLKATAPSRPTKRRKSKPCNC